MAYAVTDKEKTQPAGGGTCQHIYRATAYAVADKKRLSPLVGELASTYTEQLLMRLLIKKDSARWWGNLPAHIQSNCTRGF